MARYQVILVYDGTQFQGYQRLTKTAQPAQLDTAGRTVQGVFESALRQLGWQGRAILAAGRTDAGVHAAGQVVAFDLDWRHSVQSLQAALNAHLPADVAVQSVRPVQDGFHPRFAALARRYRYRIFCAAQRNPLLERYAWRVWPAVSLDCLQKLAGHWSGTHDFAAFGSPPRAGGSTIRTVYATEWRAEEGMWSYYIEANAFLYHMVRRIVFTQVAVCQGKLDGEALLESLQAEPGSAGPAVRLQGLAPPQGLTLVAVRYPLESENADRE